MLNTEFFSSSVSSSSSNNRHAHNHNHSSESSNTTMTTVKAIDASDILAPSELENSDLLKNDDLNFDLVSKSLQFMTSSVDIDFGSHSSNSTSSTTLPKNSSSSSTTVNNISNVNNKSSAYSIGKLLN